MRGARKSRARVHDDGARDHRGGIRPGRRADRGRAVAGVRDEPPLDQDVETRLLLRRPNPEKVTGRCPPPGSPTSPTSTAARPATSASSATWTSANQELVPAPRRTCGDEPSGASQESSVRGAVPALQRATNSQVTAKSNLASQAVSPSTEARLAPSAPRAQLLDLDREQHLVAGSNDAPEANVFDAAEQWQRTGVTLVAQQRDRAGLRQRLELEHAREDRIAGKVPGEEILVAADPIARSGRPRARSRRRSRRSGTAAGAAAVRRDPTGCVMHAP